MVIMTMVVMNMTIMELDPQDVQPGDHTLMKYQLMDQSMDSRGIILKEKLIFCDRRIHFKIIKKLSIAKGSSLRQLFNAQRNFW